ncbi:hypothetical protein NPX13_g11446 [Xylaria arbuscula]|uniref:Transcription factor domain-containing protein n=1 Tax=Xylaria arbuscula TaxID=114810 RepID=A0A9W8N342_9PEZI|nr:hypothetical protein NPX13_g11446 [Xylaria arbuscula]
MQVPPLCFVSGRTCLACPDRRHSIDDQEFCVLPLTHDFEANPFRFDPKTGRGSQLLLHCILAISYKHISRGNGRYSREAKAYKKTAFRLLNEAEGTTLSNPLQANHLDALLILMTLDCATSARGPWTWYLQRAYKMIQATESLNVQKTPRIQARIDMLVWWDVTLALTTRKGCIMSGSTMLSLLNPTSTLANPNFYSVSGCPQELFGHMIRLASYAREYELASTMAYVKFDMDLINDAATNIREWQNPKPNGYGDDIADRHDYGDTDPVEFLQSREDIYHCAEAWRYGLLLYIERVFRLRNQPASPVLRFLARRSMNHVLACRRSSTVQKQLLLPVFLAGCEITDEYLQQQALLYCHWWNEQARYEMFLTVAGLLEEIWVKNDPREWWGSILDQKAAQHLAAWRLHEATVNIANGRLAEEGVTVHAIGRDPIARGEVVRLRD